MKIVKSENGSILPLMIAIVFIVAYLLVMKSSQIELKAASYERTRIYMKMSLLEREGFLKLEDFLPTVSLNEEFSIDWELRDGALMSVNGLKNEKVFDFYYRIVYNGHVRSGNRSIANAVENALVE